MALNLQQRFLYLFADYRDAIEQQQHHADELLVLRARNEELREELRTVRKDSLDRERELNDRLMRLRFGDRIASPADITASAHSEPAAQPEANNPHTWKQSMQAKFQQDLQARAERLRNDAGSNSTN